jgi:hypothetical protein
MPASIAGVAMVLTPCCIHPIGFENDVLYRACMLIDDDQPER